MPNGAFYTQTSIKSRVVIKIVVTFLNYIFIINICESIKYVCQNIPMIGLGWQYQHENH